MEIAADGDSRICSFSQGKPIQRRERGYKKGRKGLLDGFATLSAPKKKKQKKRERRRKK